MQRLAVGLDQQSLGQVLLAQPAPEIEVEILRVDAERALDRPVGPATESVAELEQEVAEALLAPALLDVVEGGVAEAGGEEARGAALILWLASGRTRIGMDLADEEYFWKVGTGRDGARLALGRCLWGGAEADVARILVSDEKDPDFDGDAYGRLGAQLKINQSWGVVADVKIADGDTQWFVGPRISW